MGTGVKKEPVILKSGRKVTVAQKNYSSKGLVQSGVISSRDYEMDNRATIAVSMAIKKAKVLGKPIAKYDRVTGMTYLEYIDGRREIIE